MKIMTAKQINFVSAETFNMMFPLSMFGVSCVYFLSYTMKALLENDWRNVHLIVAKYTVIKSYSSMLLTFP